MSHCSHFKSHHEVPAPVTGSVSVLKEVSHARLKSHLMQATRQTERPEQSQESKADGGLLLSHQGPQASPLGRLKTLTLNSPFPSVEQSSVVMILSQQSKMELLTPPCDERGVDALC